MKIIKRKDEKLSIENWRSEIEKMNSRGINSMSLSEITGIPRPTVSRKVKKLLEKDLVTMDRYKLIHPETVVNKKALVKIQNISVAAFSKFAFTIFNLLIFS